MTAHAYGRIEMNAEGPGFLLSDAPAHVMIRLKAVFPALHKASRGPFRFPPDKMTCADLDWFVQRYPMELGEGVARALKTGVTTLKADRAEAGRILSPNWTPPTFAGLRPGQAVRDGQARNVEILQRFEGLLVADRVGAGKTYTAGAAMLREGNLPAVVVAPAHLSRQWVEVLHRFTTLTAWEVETTKPYDLPPADVYVFRYSNIGKWVDAFGQFTDQAGLGLVVFDEISELRHGEDTVKGRACLGLARAARRRLGLDATPLYNWGVEIWTIMQYLRPEVFGEREDFVRGGCQCLIISLRSGKGLDGLQAASKTVILGELDWSPATHTQVIGRLAREGQEADEVHAIFPVAADGSDPPMVQMTGLKASEQHGVLDGDAPLDASARDDGSRVQALVERYLKKQDGRAA